MSTASTITINLPPPLPSPSAATQLLSPNSLSASSSVDISTNVERKSEGIFRPKTPTKLRYSFSNTEAAIQSTFSPKEAANNHKAVISPSSALSRLSLRDPITTSSVNSFVNLLSAHSQTIKLLKVTLSTLDLAAAQLVCETFSSLISLESIELHLRDVALHSAQLLCQSLPTLQSLHTILLRGCNVGDGGCEILTKALMKHVEIPVQMLDLSENSITDRGMKELAKLIVAGKELRALELEDNLITEVGALILGRALSLSYLEPFPFSSSSSSSSSAVSSSSSSSAPSSLSSPTAASNLANSTSNANFAVRVSTGSPRQSTPPERFTPPESPHIPLPRLSTPARPPPMLNSTGNTNANNPLASDSLPTTAYSLHLLPTFHPKHHSHSALRSLNLRSNQIRGCALLPISLLTVALGSPQSSPRFPAVTSADLEHEYALGRFICDSAACEANLPIDYSPYSHALTELDFSLNEIYDDGALILARCLATNSSLQRLSLSFCKIGDVGANAIFRALIFNSTLSSLTLSLNTLTQQCAEALAQLLKVSSTLNELNLNNNLLNDSAITHLGSALLTSPGLNRLFLAANNLTAASSAALLSALQKNDNLLEIDVDGNDLDESSAAAIESLSQQKRAAYQRKIDWFFEFNEQELNDQRINADMQNESANDENEDKNVNGKDISNIAPPETPQDAYSAVHDFETKRHQMQLTLLQHLNDDKAEFEDRIQSALDELKTPRGTSSPTHAPWEDKSYTPQRRQTAGAPPPPVLRSPPSKTASPSTAAGPSSSSSDNRSASECVRSYCDHLLDRSHVMHDIPLPPLNIVNDMLTALKNERKPQSADKKNKPFLSAANLNALRRWISSPSRHAASPFSTATGHTRRHSVVSATKQPEIKRTASSAASPPPRPQF